MKAGTGPVDPSRFGVARNNPSVATSNPRHAEWQHAFHDRVRESFERQALMNERDALAADPRFAPASVSRTAYPRNRARRAPRHPPSELSRSTRQRVLANRLAAAARRSRGRPRRRSAARARQRPARAAVRRRRESSRHRPAPRATRSSAKSALQRLVAAVHVEIAVAAPIQRGRRQIDLDARARRDRTPDMSAGPFENEGARRSALTGARRRFRESGAAEARPLRRDRFAAPSPSQSSALGPTRNASRLARDRGAAALGHRPAARAARRARH